ALLLAALGHGAQAVAFAPAQAAAPAGDTPRSPAPDAAARTPPALPPGALDRYRNDPAYAYGRPRAEQPSLWNRLMRWLTEALLYPAAQAGHGLWRTLFFLAAVLVVAWGVTRALRAEGSRLFAPRDARMPGASGALLLHVDDIGAVDLGARLRRALGDRDWREATRLRYLLLLQRLDARGEISWRRGATNHDYLRQVRAARPGAFARDFAAATRAFAFVWYGRAPLDTDRFARLAARFDALDAMLGGMPEGAPGAGRPQPTEAPA
ncbi:MAG: DUF4129 domain-containing protein, partial [Rubricoccaceae bacterium]